jgi:hypothetical protein
MFAVSHPKSMIFATGNQSAVENLTAACSLYNSFVLLYNEIILLDRSSNGLTAPPVQTNSNTTPDPTPDKTGNNREIKFKELNLEYTDLPIRQGLRILQRHWGNHTLDFPLIETRITGKIELENARDLL